MKAMGLPTMLINHLDDMEDEVCMLMGEGGVAIYIVCGKWGEYSEANPIRSPLGSCGLTPQAITFASERLRQGYLVKSLLETLVLIRRLPSS